MTASNYDEGSIRSLDWREHIRLRPGMYIGKLGDGNAPDDGIYVLVKEVLDNCIDEHMMGFGSKIEITIEDRSVTARDYGRGGFLWGSSWMWPARSIQGKNMTVRLFRKASA